MRRHSLGWRPADQKEHILNRRQLLVAGLFYAATRSAGAQEQLDKFDADTRPVEGEEELWYLLSAIDTLIFVMTGVVLKEPRAVPRTIREFEPYGLQFADLNGSEAFNGALQSYEGKARVQGGLSTITAATQRTASLLSDTILSDPLRDSICKSFSRASTLLLARSSENAQWWCNCYGLKVINC
jgi:hypothetical protein